MWSPVATLQATMHQCADMPILQILLESAKKAARGDTARVFVTPNDPFCNGVKK